MSPLLARLAEVRWPAVLFLLLLSFGLLAVWNSPLMFGPAWARAAAPTRRPKGRRLAWRLAGAAVLHLPLLVGLGALVGRGDTFHGLCTGFGLALGLVVPTLGAVALLAARPPQLFLVEAGFYAVFLAMAGVVLAY